MKKVKEVQDYLEKRGIIVSETSIINAAINIARRTSGMGDWVFVREFRGKEKGKGEIEDEI